MVFFLFSKSRFYVVMDHLELITSFDGIWDVYPDFTKTKKNFQLVCCLLHATSNKDSFQNHDELFRLVETEFGVDLLPRTKKAFALYEKTKNNAGSGRNRARSGRDIDSDEGMDDDEVPDLCSSSEWPSCLESRHQRRRHVSV